MKHIEGFLGEVLNNVKKDGLLKIKIFNIIKEIYGDILKEKDFYYEDGKISFYLKPIFKQEIKNKEKELVLNIKENLNLDINSIGYYSKK